MNSGLAFYARLFGRPGKTGQRSPVDRNSLPSVAAYLTQRGLLSRNPRGKSMTIVCPSHKGGDERNPSMLVSLADGHFRCMACGAKGGDIIALHRLITGLGFREAVQDLGGRFHD